MLKKKNQKLRETLDDMIRENGKKAPGKTKHSAKVATPSNTCQRPLANRLMMIMMKTKNSSQNRVIFSLVRSGYYSH
jgi:hypothetical protein